MHKSGFVTIIGNPNAGKSTLMNALLGEELSITSPKAQTTREKVLGILNGPDYQIVFSDTPGILNPHYRLQESMLKSIENILPDYRLNVCSYTLHGFLEARQALSEHECSVSIETKRKIGKGSVVHIGKGGKTHGEGKLE